jgi:hypothetical protein
LVKDFPDPLLVGQRLDLHFLRDMENEKLPLAPLKSPGNRDTEELEGETGQFQRPAKGVR